jgi:Fe2+ transport system protein FeoA
MVIRPLSTLEPPGRGRIVKVGGGGARRRLLDMGIVPGAAIEVRRVAPLGDPVLIRVKGYDLALRKVEAEHIQVELTLMPLSMAAAGETVEMASLKAGWGLQRRLAGLGLKPGARVKVVSGSPGPVVLEIDGSRLSLGQGVARKVMVNAAEGEEA